MSKIKSFSVGDGDMFYIKHSSSNLTIIDSNLPLDDADKQDDIVSEIKAMKDNKRITRFVSTHPDQDHIGGLKILDEEIDILNFYCVKNNATKDDETNDFKHYKNLHNSDKAFYLEEGVVRKWMNDSDGDSCMIGSAGINVLWPIIANEYFQNALTGAENGESPNNISPIIKYSLNNSATILWMGDLETEFMKSISEDVKLPKINILFAPHHGRDSGKVPEKWLKEMDPDIIVIGEALSDNLNYYQGYNTITQNSAGNITFYLKEGVVNIFSEKEDYTVDFLSDNQLESDEHDEYYLGSLNL